MAGLATVLIFCAIFWLGAKGQMLAILLPVGGFLGCAAGALRDRIAGARSEMPPTTESRASIYAVAALMAVFWIVIVVALFVQGDHALAGGLLAMAVVGALVVRGLTKPDRARRRRARG